MATKPETTFTTAVNKLVPKTVYRMKTHNPYLGGIPDFWYSGNFADIWIEYKYIPKLPARSAIVPDLSALQVDWLEGRYVEGRKVYVVVGSPEGCVIYMHRQWLCPYTAEQFKRRCITKQQLALWISQSTEGINAFNKTYIHGSESARRNS